MIDCQSDVSRLPLPAQQLQISYQYYHLLLPLSGTLCATCSAVLICVRQDCCSCPQKVLRWWRQAGLSIPEHLKQHDPPSPSITDNLCKWENIWAVLPPLRQSILLQMLTWPYVQQFSWEILKHLGSLCKSRAVFHSSCIWLHLVWMSLLDTVPGSAPILAPVSCPCLWGSCHSVCSHLLDSCFGNVTGSLCCSSQGQALCGAQSWPSEVSIAESIHPQSGERLHTPCHCPLLQIAISLYVTAQYVFWLGLLAIPFPGVACQLKIFVMGFFCWILKFNWGFPCCWSLASVSFSLQLDQIVLQSDRHSGLTIPCLPF